MSVSVDSGEFKLMRDVNVDHQPSRAKVYSEWIKAFQYQVPKAINHLADVIEDVFTYELWKDYYLDTPDQFFERIGIYGLDLENPSRLISDLRDKKSGKREEIQARIKRVQEARKNGDGFQAICDREGISLGTAHSDAHSDAFSENSVYTKKTEKEPRRKKQFNITQYTKPTTAAQKIRATFGDEFAIEMMRAMQLELDQEVTR